MLEQGVSQRAEYSHTLSGAWEFLRSQTLIIGSDSRGVAVTSLVGYLPLDIEISVKESRVLYLLRIPGNSAHSFPPHIVERQTLLLCLDIPHGDETRAATCNQDMCHLLVPIQTLDIVGASGGASKSVRILKVVEVVNVQLLPEGKHMPELIPNC